MRMWYPNPVLISLCLYHSFISYIIASMVHSSGVPSFISYSSHKFIILIAQFQFSNCNNLRKVVPFCVPILLIVWLLCNVHFMTIQDNLCNPENRIKLRHSLPCRCCRMYDKSAAQIPCIDPPISTAVSLTGKLGNAQWSSVNPIAISSSIHVLPLVSHGIRPRSTQQE